MMIELGNLYPADWTGVPPHMSSGDLPIWQRYHSLHKNEYKGFYYDVAITPVQDLPAGIEPNLLRMWQWNISKRIDAVGITDSEVHVFEVRVAASAGALGAILMYKRMLDIVNAFQLPTSYYILTDLTDPVLPALALMEGITVIEA